MVNLELKDPPAAGDVGILNNTTDPLEIDKFRQARLWKMVRTKSAEQSGGRAENDTRPHSNSPACAAVDMVSPARISGNLTNPAPLR